MVVGYVAPFRYLDNDGLLGFSYKYKKGQSVEISSGSVITGTSEVKLECSGGYVGGIIGVASHFIELKLGDTITLNNARGLEVDAKIVGGIVGGLNSASLVSTKYYSSDKGHSVVSLGENNGFKIGSEGSFGGIVGEAVLNTINSLEDDITMINLYLLKYVDLELSGFGVEGSFDNLGGIAGKVVDAGVLSCNLNGKYINEFKPEANVSNFGGIVGLAKREFKPTNRDGIDLFGKIVNFVSACTNYVSLTSNSPKTNLGGIVGEAVNYNVSGTNGVEGKSNSLTLKNGTLEGNAWISDWATGSYSQGRITNAGDSITYDTFISTYTGSVGGIVGNAKLSKNSSISSGETIEYSSRIEGNNYATINGFYYYGEDEAPNTAFSYYSKNTSVCPDDLSHTVRICDNRGNILGSKNKEDVIIKDTTNTNYDQDIYKNIKVLNNSGDLETFVAREFVTNINWAERNEYGDTSKNYQLQPAYVVGYKVTKYLYKYENGTDTFVMKSTEYRFDNNIQVTIKNLADKYMFTDNYEQIKEKAPIYGADAKTTAGSVVSQSVLAENIVDVLSDRYSSGGISSSGLPTGEAQSFIYTKKVDYEVIYYTIEQSTYTYTANKYGIKIDEHGTIRVLLQDCGGIVNYARNAKQKAFYMSAETQRAEGIRILYEQTTTNNIDSSDEGTES